MLPKNQKPEKNSVRTFYFSPRPNGVQPGGLLPLTINVPHICLEIF